MAINVLRVAGMLGRKLISMAIAVVINESGEASTIQYSIMSGTPKAGNTII